MAMRHEDQRVPERWKPVVKYEGWYEVSNHGRVRRVFRCRGSSVGRILTCKIAPNEYLHVDLSKGDRKRRFRIHRLVASSWIGPPPTKRHVVNHLNGIKADNRVKNLEWCTPRQNNAHARSVGLWRPGTSSGEKNGRSVLTRKQVDAIRLVKGRIGQREIAAMVGVARSLIQRIHQGKAWASQSDESEWPIDLRVREFPK